MKIKYFLISCLAFAALVDAWGQGDREITFNDIYKERVFNEADLSGLRFMNDGKNYTLLYEDMILRYSLRNGDLVDVLFSAHQLGRPDGGSIGDYTFSQDDSRLLIAVDKERIWRHSYRADYYVCDLADGAITFLSEKGKQQLGTFSPDGLKVAYVRDNNLYVLDLEEVAERQLTFDGADGKIINGAPDWVYEEEFAFADGFAWSADSRRIAYYRTDESHVRPFTLTTYGGLYPEWKTFKYPKAGEINSIVSIRVVEIESGQHVEMDIGEETDQYIPRIEWTGRPGELCILRLNRAQDRLEVLLADAGTGDSRVILAENNDSYIEEPDDETIVFLDDGEQFIYQSERNGFMHFYLYDMEGNALGPLTSGEWDVIDFLGCDEKRGIFYYTSYEGSSVQSNVWSIRLDGSGKKRISEAQGWNTAEFSKTFDYYIHTHSSAVTPKYITLHNAKGNILSLLEDNSALKESARSFGLPEKELFTLELPLPGGAELNAYLYKPKGFRENFKYPMLMYVYGGPGSQKVRDEWGTDAWHYLLLQKGYVIVCVDNRGTGGKGEAFRKSTYLQLGLLETQDQIEAARYMGSLPWIDESRIGIWGGSYGGFISALCITKGEDVFRMAISQYPVTHYKYYNTIYTERFMRTPKENPDGYELNSPIHYADRLKGKLLLIHGMADDNVHFQNSVDFANALIEAGKQFDMLFYPNQIHGIRRQAGMHMMERMTDFVDENL